MQWDLFLETWSSRTLCLCHYSSFYDVIDCSQRLEATKWIIDIMTTCKCKLLDCLLPLLHASWHIGPYLTSKWHILNQSIVSKSGIIPLFMFHSSCEDNRMILLQTSLLK